MISKFTFGEMVGFVRVLYGFFGTNLKALALGDGSGQSSAAAPGGACDVAGIGLHRVTLSLADHGGFAGAQPRLISYMYSTS
jgi:hypothetical protein